MELTTLRYFQAIARARHLTRAAQTLGVTQPALSAMMRKLEGELGASLLHRVGRGVELTEAGRVFLAHAEDALRAADQARDAVRRLETLEAGSIRVGGGATAMTYLLPPVVSAVRKKYPGLRFYFREAGSNTVAASVLSGELDLGIVTLPIVAPGAEALVRIPVVSDELRLVVPPGHPLASRRARAGVGVGVGVGAGVGVGDKGGEKGGDRAGFRWKDIADEPFVAFEGGTAVRTVVDHAAEAAGVRLNVVMELRSIESIKRMVQQGIGVGLVSRFALREGEGMICRDTRLIRSLAIIRLRDLSPANAAFERELIASIGGMLGGGGGGGGGGGVGVGGGRG